MKIYPSIFVKVNFGENLRRFTKNSSHLYKNYFQFTLDALKNDFSHLIAIENTKIKRGDQKTFYLIALEMVKFVGSSQNYRPQAKKSRYRGVSITL